MTLQFVRDWVVRFSARGLANGQGQGKPSLLNDDQRTASAQAFKPGLTPYLDGVVHWRLCDLAQWMWEEFCDRTAHMVDYLSLAKAFRSSASPLAADAMLLWC